MGRYKVYWSEHDGHGGVESHWVQAEARGYVDTYSGGKAISLIKEQLGKVHLKRFKCKNFRAVKR